ncbi:helix-turn-helix transcriptional regulator [Nocardia mexicana]|uniref:Putative DNA-binding transcriptional regulator YafY n=1 Tax=Nocardia mexicana TaxID=279262 RepID=A0A370H814_9NOCA|nr:YafY family protein [Nocardia mexicana]RDI52807.1 putative DNA-binding transcriptional regulator YafY [Nocardia mexicana]
MLETSARLLRLLSLLQSRPEWPGPELADRLDVTVRTIRRDVERLRALGYPVHSLRGSAGYRLGAGSALPPLLLDDEETVAVAIGLRTVSGGGGVTEAAGRALAKLNQVLPSRLRHRLDTVQRAVTRVDATASRLDSDVLLALTDACRRRERLRFDYTDNTGRETVRDVEPHAVVGLFQHWYLVAFDTGPNDWRSFRIDRIRPRTPTGPRFTTRTPPGGDFATYLADRMSAGAWPWQATVTLHGPAFEVADRLWPGMGMLEAVDDHHCLLHVGGDSPTSLAWMITSLDTDFTVTEPPELAEALRTLAYRCLQGVAT